MKKRIIPLALVLALVFLMTACGNTADPGGGNNNSNPSSSVNNGNTSNSPDKSSTPEEPPLDYPTRTVTLVVPYTAGGGMDNTARLWAKYAEKYCGETIVISNIGGGSGAVGAQSVLSAAADGYTMLAFDPGAGFVTTSVNTVPFDTMNDFAIVGRITQDPRVLIARNDDGRFSNSEEFCEYVKEHPGALTCSTPGATTDASIALAVLQSAGLELSQVPFASAGEAKSALLGKHVDVAGVSVSDAVALIKGGDTETFVVGVFDETRSDMLPEVPTFKELGYDAQWITSRGIGIKAGTDQRIVDYWEDIMAKVAEDPEFIAEQENLGIAGGYLNSEVYTKYCGECFETIKEIFK